MSDVLLEQLFADKFFPDSDVMLKEYVNAPPVLLTRFCSH